jgi:hypothetical protein
MFDDRYHGVSLRAEDAQQMRSIKRTHNDTDLVCVLVICAPEALALVTGGVVDSEAVACG